MSINTSGEAGWGRILGGGYKLVVIEFNLMFSIIDDKEGCLARIDMEVIDKIKRDISQKYHKKCGLKYAKSIKGIFVCFSHSPDL